MKRIKLITYHDAWSYGACLQTIATTKVLESLGHAVEVINYHNPYESRYRNGNLLRYTSLREFLKIIIKKFFFQSSKYSERAFGNVGKDYILLTKRYDNLNDLLTLRADVLAVGSDQVWNPSISNGIDPAFFLDFGKAERRISIASSMGDHVFSEREKKYVYERLKSFSSISVREQYAKDQIKTLTNKTIKILLDPTLLVSNEFWRNHFAKCYPKQLPKEGYILVFVLSEHFELSHILYEYKKKMNLPVYRIMINTYRTKGVDHVIPGPSLEEFVDLIDRATLVITDSFHGTAFSINMRTPFIFLLRKDNNARMIELLQQTGLESRVFSMEKPPEPMECNFKIAEDFLQCKRKEDINWLETAIEE